MGPEAWGSHICEDRENTKWPPQRFEHSKKLYKRLEKGESENQENVKYGVGRVSGVRGSIRLVKLLCLLLARCLLDAYGPKM